MRWTAALVNARRGRQGRLRLSRCRAFALRNPYHDNRWSVDHHAFWASPRSRGCRWTFFPDSRFRRWSSRPSIPGCRRRRWSATSPPASSASSPWAATSSTSSRARCPASASSRCIFQPGVDVERRRGAARQSGDGRPAPPAARHAAAAGAQVRRLVAAGDAGDGLGQGLLRKPSFDDQAQYNIRNQLATVSGASVPAAVRRQVSARSWPTSIARRCRRAA